MDEHNDQLGDLAFGGARVLALTPLMRLHRSCPRCTQLCYTLCCLARAGAGCDALALCDPPSHNSPLPPPCVRSARRHRDGAPARGRAHAGQRRPPLRPRLLARRPLGPQGPPAAERQRHEPARAGERARAEPARRAARRRAGGAAGRGALPGRGAGPGVMCMRFACLFCWRLAWPLLDSKLGRTPGTHTRLPPPPTSSRSGRAGERLAAVAPARLQPRHRRQPARPAARRRRGGGRARGNRLLLADGCLVQGREGVHCHAPGGNCRQTITCSHLNPNARPARQMLQAGADEAEAEGEVGHTLPSSQWQLLVESATQPVRCACGCALRRAHPALASVCKPCPHTLSKPLVRTRQPAHAPPSLPRSCAARRNR